MTIGPEPMSKIFLMSVRLGTVRTVLPRRGPQGDHAARSTRTARCVKFREFTMPPLAAKGAGAHVPHSRGLSKRGWLTAGLRHVARGQEDAQDRQHYARADDSQKQGNDGVPGLG